MNYVVATCVAHRTIFEASCARSAFRRPVISVGQFISFILEMDTTYMANIEHVFTHSKFVIHQTANEAT